MESRLLVAELGKSRQVYASRRRREILEFRLLAAGLGKSRQVGDDEILNSTGNSIQDK